MQWPRIEGGVAGSVLLEGRSRNRQNAGGLSSFEIPNFREIGEALHFTSAFGGESRIFGIAKQEYSGCLEQPKEACSEE